MLSNEFPNIFSPIQIGSVTLKNRLQFSPIVSAHAEPLSGDVTPALIEFVSQQARTGVGLVTIGSTPVDFDRGRDFMGCMSVIKDYDVPLLKQLTEEAHRYGAKISAEIMHAGSIANPMCLGEKKAFVPWHAPHMDSADFEEMNEDAIQVVIDHFREAALRLKNSGFDMVMIHAAHGNLLSSFLSEAANQRKDQYGGSLENRVRFPTMVARAIRETVGTDMGIDIRISSYEGVPCSPTVDDIAYYINTLSDYVDCVHLSGGMFHPAFARYMIPSYYRERNINIERTAYIRSKVHIPVTAVGNIPDIYAAEKIIKNGQADMVAMARNLIADPQLLEKAKRGSTKEIRQCLHCSECTEPPAVGAPVRCAVNPALGRECKYREIPLARQKKLVMVIGGGPAGMQAAQVAVKRGHDVVLYEKSDRIGGFLWEASALQYKDYHRKYLQWDIDETMRCGAEIILNTKVTPEIIQEENPDALIIAIGADYLRPPIKGIENAMTVTDVEILKKPLGKKVAFCGAGFSAVECAIALTLEGHSCVCIDALPADKLYQGISNLVAADIQAEICSQNIKILDQSKIVEIGKNFIRTERNGNEMIIECDSVVAALGLKVDTDMIEGLNNLVEETYIIGDAREIGNIKKANHDGFNIAVEI